MVEGPVEDLIEGGRCGIEQSSRWSSPLRHFTSDVVARLLWFGGRPGIQRDGNLVVEPPLSILRSDRGWRAVALGDGPARSGVQAGDGLGSMLEPMGLLDRYIDTRMTCSRQAPPQWPPYTV